MTHDEPTPAPPRDPQTTGDRARAVAPAIAARASQHDRDVTFPFEDFDDLYSAGLLSLTMPVADGGLGGGPPCWK